LLEELVGLAHDPPRELVEQLRTDPMSGEVGSYGLKAVEVADLEAQFALVVVSSASA
jgi:hypothetical protein